MRLHDDGLLIGTYEKFVPERVEKDARKCCDMKLKETDMPREREWKNYFSPRKTLVALGLKKGMMVADLGCGYGTFAIAASQIVGNKGNVFALDIDRKMLRVVTKRAR